MSDSRFKIQGSILIVYFFLTLSNYELNSQEVLLQPDYNPELYNKQLNLYKSAVSIGDTVELPFLDDFAKISRYPDAEWWADKNVYLNNTRCISPPSIGVATFDMFDQLGKIHENSNTLEFISDILTSNPINLYYPGNTSIYLSFNYQRGGNGDFPETKDSLVVDFFSPVDTIWNQVYRIQGGNNVDFETAMIQITDEKYLQKGFRFRIKNLASFEDLNTTSYRKRDGDNWNIDFVYLDTGRTAVDTIIGEIAMVNQISSLLRGYTSVPWKHTDAEIMNIIQNHEIPYAYTNRYYKGQNIEECLILSDITNGNLIVEDFCSGNLNIESGETLYSNFDYSFNLATNSDDSAVFEVKTYIVEESDSNRVDTLLNYNDTLAFVQKFLDYYSYDDGSAEFGYGVVDEGADNARLAVQFTPLKEDTIRGVHIEFLHYIRTSSSPLPVFYIGIWDNKTYLDTTGNIIHEPKDLIYLEKGHKAIYSSGINYFFDSAFIPPDTFYVGIIQTTNEFLNVGFDVNTISKNKLYYNINGDWYKSSFTGSLMIRPYFSEDKILNINKKEIDPFEFKLYPNPANEIIYIKLNNPLYQNYITRMYNSSGVLVRNYNFKVSSIDIHDLPNGLYFIQLSSSNSPGKMQKLIIQR